MATLGFILVYGAAVLAVLPCPGFLNAGMFVVGLIFIYHG